MAGDKHPWRDIYSVADWNHILANTTTYSAPIVVGTHRGRAAAAPPPVGAWVAAAYTPAQLLARLTGYITQYHAIVKDDRTLFNARRNLLAQVQTAAAMYIQALGANAQLGVGVKQLNPANPGRIDEWIDSLSRRAQKKSQYLVTIANWITTSKDKHRDPVLLMQDLVHRHSDNTGGSADEPLLSTTPYARMEKIDPYHRGITFFVHDAVSIDPYHNNPMAVAFNQWLGARLGGGAVAPGPTFYEWLENHPICTGTAGVTAGFDTRYKTEVTKVDYAAALRPVLIQQGVGLRIDLGTGGGIQPLDSASQFRRSGKGAVGGAAYAWDRNGNIWLHEHAGDFRHTSFQAGKKIRCSGMIRVNHGKVDFVSDESGHYAPGRSNLYFFVEFLYSKGVTAGIDAMEVEYYGSTGTTTVSLRNYRTWGRTRYPAYPGAFALGSYAVT